MPAPIIPRDPLDKFKLIVDFTTWLGSSGANVTSVAWTVPSGLTISNEGISSNEATAYFDVDNTAVEREFELACVGTTDESPTREKTQRIIVSIEKDV